MVAHTTTIARIQETQNDTIGLVGLNFRSCEMAKKREFYTINCSNPPEVRTNMITGVLEDGRQIMIVNDNPPEAILFSSDGDMLEYWKENEYEYPAGLSAHERGLFSRKQIQDLLEEYGGVLAPIQVKKFNGSTIGFPVECSVSIWDEPAYWEKSEEIDLHIRDLRKNWRKEKKFVIYMGGWCVAFDKNGNETSL
jgi:hypothetical protein